MKKSLSVLFILACLFTLVACQASDKGKQAPSFVGKVLEKYETSCLLEVTDNGNQALASGDVVVVYTNLADCPEYTEGDYLKITFDGAVAESYPPQIHKVSNVTKTDAQGNPIK